MHRQPPELRATPLCDAGGRPRQAPSSANPKPHRTLTWRLWHSARSPSNEPFGAGHHHTRGAPASPRGFITRGRAGGGLRPADEVPGRVLVAKLSDRWRLRTTTDAPSEQDEARRDCGADQRVGPGEASRGGVLGRGQADRGPAQRPVPRTSGGIVEAAPALQATRIVVKSWSSGHDRRRQVVAKGAPWKPHR